VDLWTTLRVAHRVHSRNSSSNRAEQNEKCVTHVAGLKCYLCRRLLMRGFGRTRKTPASEPPHPRSPRSSRGSLDLSPSGRGEIKSFSRRVCVRALFDSLPLGMTEGRRSADRRIRPCSAPRKQMLPLVCACGAAARPFSPLPIRGRVGRGRARLSALHRGAAKVFTPRLSLGPRFLESPGANGRTLPGTSAANSSRTGVSSRTDGFRSRPSGVTSPARRRRSRSASGIVSRSVPR